MSFGVFDIEPGLRNLVSGLENNGFPGDGNFDPFLGTAIQTTRLKAYCTILYGGVNVTSKLDPHLISVRIVDKDMPTCEITLDDRNGQLPIPPLYAPVTVEIGWANEGSFVMFNGIQQDLEYAFGRKDGGRHMIVHAYSLDMLKHAKTPMSDNMGEGAPPGQDEGKQIPLPDWLQKMAKNANVNIAVHPYFQKFKDDHWEQNNESLMSSLTGYARQYGGLVHWKDPNHVEITRPGEDVDGSKTNSVLCKWADNLIGLRVRPLSARGQWKEATQSYYSPMKAIWNKLSKQANMSSPWSEAIASFAPSIMGAHESSAQGDAEGAADATSEGQGHGRIVINGEPPARWNCHCMIQGVRPGVDGDYIAEDAVEHIYSRQGYITWLDVTANTSATGGANIGRGYPADVVQQRFPQDETVGPLGPDISGRQTPGQAAIRDATTPAATVGRRFPEAAPVTIVDHQPSASEQAGAEVTPLVTGE